MNRIGDLVTIITLATLCNAVSAHGAPDGEHAVGGIAQVVIVDRSTGGELVPHFYSGEYWVSGTPGAAYSISIRNRLGERLLAVTSVDGVNVVSGATAAWDQTGYVFGPNQRYEITGWRKSDSEVAAFTFTESPNSYAERTGRPANVGVIGVALFREQQPEPVSTSPEEPVRDAGSAASQKSPAAERAASAAPSSAPQPLMRSEAPPLQPRAPKLGTGHGERQSSYVSHTDFLRLQAEPNEIVRIRYDSFDNLVAMGVIRRPRPATPATNPFPGSPAQQYVPDPPGTGAGAR
jgi:hypothetical protein